VIVGTIGVVVPLLPGLMLSWAGVALWSIVVAEGSLRWFVLAAVSMLVLAGVTIKYLLPGRNLKNAGVPNLTLFVGGVLGLIGLFVIPLLGLPIGFVLGVWLAELRRLRGAGPAWGSTKHALKAVGLSMLIELCAAVGIAAIWVGGMILV
jgi:uncharacterized protein YqgC (DUF456 family)